MRLMVHRAASRFAKPALGALLLAILLALISSCSRERVVYREPSEYQEILVTEGPDRTRTLRFGDDGAVQSRVRLGQPEELLLPYVRASMVGLAFLDREPDRILVVGLGGGSIPMFLHRALPSTKVEVVELDRAVVEVARRWFDLTEDQRLQVVVEDGRRFVERASEPYDVIFLDAYGASSIPRSLTTLQFLEAVRRALSPDGVVIANLWEGRSNPVYGSMATTYQHVFDELLVFPVPTTTNRILVALPRPLGRTPAELRSELDQLSTRLGGDLNLSWLLGRMDPRATERRFDGEVLRDSESSDSSPEDAQAGE